MSGFGQMGHGLVSLFTAEKDKRDKLNALRQNREFVEGQDWQPEYASSHAPQYKNTQSPLARSYLESILTGNNSDLTYSGSPNGAQVKAWQDDSRDQMYGTPAQLQAQSQAQRAAQSYAPTPITRQVGRTDDGQSSDSFAAERNVLMDKYGINQTQLEGINKRGRAMGYNVGEDGHDRAVLWQGYKEGGDDTGSISGKYGTHDTLKPQELKPEQLQRLNDLAAANVSDEEYQKAVREIVAPAEKESKKESKKDRRLRRLGMAFGNFSSK